MKFTGLFIGIAKHTVAQKTTYTQPLQKETQDVEQPEILQWLQALARFCVVAPQILVILNIILCVATYAIVTFPSEFVLNANTVVATFILLATIISNSALLGFFYKMYNRLQPEIVATKNPDILNVVIGASTAVTMMMLAFTAAYVALLAFIT